MIEMPTYKIHTYGCQMNYSDTERIETYLEALGFEKAKDEDDSPNLILLNTCSIKQKAEDKVFGEIRKIDQFKKDRSNLAPILVVTGCMVRTSSSRYSEKRDRLFNRMRELDIALRIEELPLLASLLREITPDSEIKAIEEESLEDYFRIDASHSSLSKTQAFVPVSTGCDKFCTYCIVPYSRGREQSRAMEEIIDESKKLVENGVKEITLIGQTVNSYGVAVSDKINKKFAYLEEGKEPFVCLLEELDKLHEKGLERLRFTSPHPRDMSDQLIEAMGNLKTQMPYLHLPVQAGDDRTLKRMNRTYTVERYCEIMKKLREKIPDISITTDIIVGFCGETEEEFENTYKFFEKMEFEHAYISRYSERKGTFASKKITDDISSKIKAERWHSLNNLLKESSAKTLEKFKGKTVKVLVEEQNGKEASGRSEHFKTVQFQSDKKLIGQLVEVRILDSKDWVLKGEIV
jgi:tRNA-2-methylthio-N6-dimethylallyladenosine synthase